MYWELALNKKKEEVRRSMREWKGFTHGINLGGWVSQCPYFTEHYDNFIKEDDIKVIKSWGLDHVRVPIDYELIEEKDGTVIESGYKYIDNVLEWCEAAGLNVLLDLHKTAGFFFHEDQKETGFFSDEKLQERFYYLWERFATRYGNIGENVAFELLNEVTDKDYCDKWNEISNKCIARIRKIAPNVKILVGGYWNNSVEAVKDIAMPADENVIYNFHCYDPLVFTHQGASWIKEMDVNFRMPFDSTYKQYEEYAKKNLNFREGSIVSLGDGDENAVISENYFEHLFAEAFKVAEERNVPLYCGEYGVIDLVGPEDTIKWYKAFSTVLNKYKVGRAAWTYKSMSFGIAGPKFDGLRDELLKYL